MHREEKVGACLIQHKVRPELKQWIEEQAKAQERSQGWIANKMLEESYARAQQQTQGAAA